MTDLGYAYIMIIVAAPAAFIGDIFLGVHLNSVKNDAQRNARANRNNTTPVAAANVANVEAEMTPKATPKEQTNEDVQLTTSA